MTAELRGCTQNWRSIVHQASGQLEFQRADLLFLLILALLNFFFLTFSLRVHGQVGQVIFTSPSLQMNCVPGFGGLADGSVFSSLQDECLKVLRAVPTGRPSIN